MEPIEDPLNSTVEPGQESLPEPKANVEAPAAPEQAPEPQGEPGEIPAEEPKAAEPKVVTVEDRLKALEEENKALKADRTQPSEPKASDDTQAKAAEAEAAQRNQYVGWRNSIISEAQKLQDEYYRDKMIAEHGEEAVNRILAQAPDLRVERAVDLRMEMYRASQAAEAETKAAQQEWTSTMREMGARAKSYGLGKDIFETDPMLKDYRSLAYPDKYVKQAIDDRLFRLRTEKGIPPGSREIVTAEEHANRQAVYQRTSGTPGNPKTKSLGEQIYEQAQADAGAIDPLSQSRPA